MRGWSEQIQSILVGKAWLQEQFLTIATEPEGTCSYLCGSGDESIELFSPCSLSFNPRPQTI